MKTILKAIIQTLCGLAIGAFFLFMLIEWASGCGEAYVDSEGKTHIGECMFTTTKKDTN
jgi:hypothetical protein